MPQQPPVLDRSRFSLFTIGDNDGPAGAAAVVADRARLHREREAGSASTEESTGLDLAEQFVRSGEWLVAAERPVGGKVFAVRRR